MICVWGPSFLEPPCVDRFRRRQKEVGWCLVGDSAIVWFPLTDTGELETRCLTAVNQFSRSVSAGPPGERQRSDSAEKSLLTSCGSEDRVVTSPL